MTKIKMIIELEYDDQITHGSEQESIDWFYNDILIGKKGSLLLHSNEIGDNVGKVKGIEILPSKEQ